MKGIGIGSGLGGVINIKRGHYEFDMKGQEGACIGSVNGDSELFIEYCDMDIYSGISNGTIIGSVMVMQILSLRIYRQRFRGQVML